MQSRLSCVYLCRKFGRDWRSSIIPSVGLLGGLIALWREELGKVDFSLRTTITLWYREKGMLGSLLLAWSTLLLILSGGESFDTKFNLCWVCSSHQFLWGISVVWLPQKKRDEGKAFEVNLEVKEFCDFISSPSLIDL